MIFGFVARSSRNDCLSLCLVSSWARRIALVRLLNTIYIGDLRYSHWYRWKLSVLRFLKSPPLKPFNKDLPRTSLIRSICFDTSTMHPESWDILMCSKNITTLAIHASPLTEKCPIPISQPFKNLKTLMLYIDTSQSTSSWPKFFEKPDNFASMVNMSQITHLYLWGEPKNARYQFGLLNTPKIQMQDFQKFPHLTHLAIFVTSNDYLSTDNPTIEDSVYISFLENQIKVLPRSIEVCVFVFDDYEDYPDVIRNILDWLNDMRKSYKRVYGLCCPSTMENIWKKYVDGCSVWDDAIQWTESGLKVNGIAHLSEIHWKSSRSRTLRKISHSQVLPALYDFYQIRPCLVYFLRSSLSYLSNHSLSFSKRPNLVDSR